MRLAVSNIAWQAEDDDRVLAALADEGVDAIEVAPTRLAPDPTSISAAEARSIRKAFESRGIEIVSMQSLLFGQPDLRLFGSDADRDQLLDYLAKIITLSGHLGAEKLVFGSPRNRLLPGAPARSQDLAAATDFFRRAGSLAYAVGAVLCIEPNPVAYGCNFVVTTDEGIQLVDAVDHAGFGLHLDAAGSTLAGENIEASVHAAGTRIQHFHASAPELGMLETEVVDHAGASRALRATGYSGFISIEMRSSDSDTNEQRVRDAIHLARHAYL
ncbi:sugar phosphate isomerase/epimerase family protein [Amnibacterium kyonggiense]|uniref:Sugar phosphate isomerase/epimerase n=1 Tax=Amnibacterium kyonggiense TaxID=595671 RepID=A0A4R7FFN1_9MICO|nr:sugar phosphate isomerase/epimerase [Amnibacterium kyonggiense]TDS74963.1 sugar phosphate isomerase/epimerase [Amnibacterium kyonggiense]